MAKAKEETKGMNAKEFKKALDNIVKEKDIDPEVVYGAMELALTSAYKKNQRQMLKYYLIVKLEK